jgi:MFS family permease
MEIMRSMTALCTGSALMNAAMAAGSAASTLVAGERMGTGWAAVPSTAAIVGTGLGTLALTWLTARRGRRAALCAGYGAAAMGAGVAVMAVGRGEMAVLVFAMLLLGLGNAGAQLSRYAAAELYPARRRGHAVGLVVWAAALGAVGGPLLLAPSGDVAGRWALTSLAGPFLLASLACGIAAVAAWAMPSGNRQVIAAAGSRTLLRAPAARTALLVMATAQVVMVAVMTAAPLDMHLHGHGLHAVGLTLSAHTLGMFGLSPVTGRLVDRLGTQPIMVAGLLALTLATTAAAMAPADVSWARPAALFLLGYAWNLCFVSGSAHLARDLPVAERLRVEGTVDAAVWGLAAAASLASTLILSRGGYSALAALSSLASAAVLCVVARRPGALRTSR